MTEYLIFSEGVDYEEGSLEAHLRYLDRWGGTPNFWDSSEDLVEAVDEARRYALSSGCKAYIVDGYSYEIVGEYAA